MAGFYPANGLIGQPAGQVQPDGLRIGPLIIFQVGDLAKIALLLQKFHGIAACKAGQVGQCLSIWLA